MPEGIIFAAVFVAFFILRAIAATVFFYYMLPDTDRCPCCDTPTLRVRSPGWNRLLPWFRTSWCYECGWKGFLRPRAPTREARGDRVGPAARDAHRAGRDARVNGAG
jgi:hypothetical protein